MESMHALEVQNSKLFSVEAAEQLRALQRECHVQSLYEVNKWTSHLQKLRKEKVSAQASSTIQISSAHGQVVSQAEQYLAH